MFHHNRPRHAQRAVADSACASLQDRPSPHAKHSAELSFPSVDLSSKVAMVTGGNTGIGYETAKALAEVGAHTFIACRSQERAAAIMNELNFILKSRH